MNADKRRYNAANLRSSAFICGSNSLISSLAGYYKLILTGYSQVSPKFRAGRLYHDRATVISTLRLHRLMTVTTALIRRELGELSPQMQDEVANKLQKLFGLA